MARTNHEEAEARAEARAVVAGEAKLLKRVIFKRYHQLPQWVQDKVNAADSEQLGAWADRIFTAESLDELFSDR